MSSVIGYGVICLSLVGLITLLCMGSRGISYIGVGYRDRYSDLTNNSLFGYDSTAIRTLYLCILSSKYGYRQFMRLNRKLPDRLDTVAYERSVI